MLRFNTLKIVCGMALVSGLPGFTARLFAAAPTQIELVPIVAWQGRPIKHAHETLVRDLRQSFGSLRFVHAVNPVLFLRTPAEVESTRMAFGEMLQRDDGVVMHAARLQEWMSATGIEPSAGEGLFSPNAGPCGELCGLDQTFNGISTRDFERMFDKALTAFDGAGFSSPKIVVFEEGLVGEGLWKVARREGFDYDWSAFRLSQVSANGLSGSLLFRGNDAVLNSLPAFARGKAQDGGRSLDHARFGIWVEAMDLKQIGDVADEAFLFAQKNGRKVLVPLMVNGDTIVHSAALVREGIAKIYERVGQQGGTVVAWSGDGNSSWDFDKLPRRLIPNIAVNPVPTEDHASKSIPEVEELEDQSIEVEPIRSHAREMSH